MDREQVLAYRVAAHHLHERLPAGSEREAAAVIGLQDFPPGLAASALSARVADADMDQLVIVYTFRGAAVAVPRDEVAVFTVALAPPDDAAARTLVGTAVDSLDPAGISATDALDRVSDAVADALADGPARARRLPPGTARAAPGRAAVVVPRLPEPPRAPVAVAGDGDPRRARGRRAARAGDRVRRAAEGARGQARAGRAGTALPARLRTGHPRRPRRVGGHRAFARSHVARRDRGRDRRGRARRPARADPRRRCRRARLSPGRVGRAAAAAVRPLPRPA